MLGLNASVVLPELIGTLAASLRATPFTRPKWPPMKTLSWFGEKPIEKTTGWQRGGQAKPVIWPSRGAHVPSLPDGLKDAMRVRGCRATRVNWPPMKRLPLGPMRTTSTVALVPGFQVLAVPAPRPTAARLARLAPPILLKLPPTKAFLPEIEIENTWPFGCGFQGKSLPVATSIAAAFWRVRADGELAGAPVGRTLVKTPPMYMT